MSASGVRSTPGGYPWDNSHRLLSWQHRESFAGRGVNHWIKSHQFFSPWWYSARVLWGFMPTLVQWFWQDATNFISLLPIGRERSGQVWRVLAPRVIFCPSWISDLGFPGWPSCSAIAVTSLSRGDCEKRRAAQLIAANFRSPSGRERACLLYGFSSLKLRRFFQLSLRG